MKARVYIDGYPLEVELSEQTRYLFTPTARDLENLVRPTRFWGWTFVVTVAVVAIVAVHEIWRLY